MDYSGTSILRSAKGLAKFVRYNEVSLYRGEQNRALYQGLLYGGSLYQGSTVSGLGQLTIHFIEF